MILSQKNIEEIAVAVIRDFQKSFFGSEADDPARFALPTPIDQFASDYLNLKVSFQKLSSDGSIYGLTAYVDTEYQIEVDGSQRSIFLKTNDVVLDKSFIEPENIRKLCGKRRFTLAHECAHQILFQLDSDDRKIACHKRPEVRKNGSRVLRTQEDWNEWQANTLGAAILMPPVRSRSGDVVHQQQKASDLLWMAFLRQRPGEDRYFLWCLWRFEISSSYPIGTTGLSEPEKGL